MLTVEDYELIRRKFFLDGMSQRAIAAELGHSRKTVAKAIAHPAPPGYRQIQPRARPAIEPYRAIIDAWRDEDQVDWGEASVIQGGVERKVQLFCMKPKPATAQPDSTNQTRAAPAESRPQR